MNWDRIEGNWKQFKGKVKQEWGKLTDDHLDVVAGNRDELAGKIQEAYGISKDEAEKQIRRFEDQYSNWIPSDVSPGPGDDARREQTHEKPIRFALPPRPHPGAVNWSVDPPSRTVLGGWKHPPIFLVQRNGACLLYRHTVPGVWKACRMIRGFGIGVVRCSIGITDATRIKSAVRWSG